MGGTIFNTAKVRYTIRIQMFRHNDDILDIFMQITSEAISAPRWVELFYKSTSLARSFFSPTRTTQNSLFLFRFKPDDDDILLD